MNDKERVETDRVWGRLPVPYVEELKRKADKLGMPLSGYVGMCIRIGDSAFSRGKRIIFEEEDLDGNLY